MPSKLTPAETLAREQHRARREALELTLEQQLRAIKVRYIRQYQFDRSRRWKADFAMVHEGIQLIVEVQGGIYTNGRHNRGAAMEDEYEKIAHALMIGWRVLPVTGKQVKSGKAIKWIEEILGMEE